MIKSNFTGTVKGVLSRSEMKSIMAGGGNIYCKMMGVQWSCNLSTLQECTESCANWAMCEGCAQFPSDEK